MPHPSPCFSLPWQTWWEEKMETVAWNFQCLLLMDMCFLGVKELNEVKGSLKEGSGHKYTLWCLEAPWLCPRPSPWNPKKIKDSHITTLLATLEAPPFPRQLQRKTTPKPCSDSWIGWLSCGHCCCQNHLDCFPGGLKDGAKFPALPWVKQKSSPAWVVLYVCVTTSLEKMHHHLPQFLYHGIKEMR